MCHVSFFAERLFVGFINEVSKIGISRSEFIVDFMVSRFLESLGFRILICFLNDFDFFEVFQSF